MKGIVIGRVILLIAGIVWLTGCVMHSTTPEWVEGASSATIYRVSEREAFLSVVEALAEELPSQSVDDDWAGNLRGYGATSRFGLDTTEYSILVFPLTGRGPVGQVVLGFPASSHRPFRFGAETAMRTARPPTNPQEHP